MSREKWEALALFLVAVAAGVVGGLLYSWVLDPVETYDAEPAALTLEGKLVYLALVGDRYAYGGDLSEAEARLAELGIDADGPHLAGLIEEYLDGGGRPEEVRNLARLAEAMGASGGVLLVFGSLPTSSPEPTAVPSPQPVVSPTPFPSPTPAPAFRLVEETAVCAEPGQSGRIAVWVLDAEGKGLAGVEIVVSWTEGQDRFFTGLRQEQGAGYADFEMAPHIEYEVALADLKGDVVQGLTSDLSAGTCPTGTLAVDWRIAFQRAP